MKKYLALVRTDQWLKNCFIFAPLFFSGHLLDVNKLGHCALAFFAFSLNASSIYIINDYMDIERDRAHPVKRLRPLASGTVAKTSAAWLCALLAILSSTIAYIVCADFAIIIMLYFLMNLLYSFGLKHVALIDVFIISLGFVLRVAAGGVVAGLAISHWLYIMTMLIALFLTFAKRRDDMLLEIRTGRKMRPSMTGYNLEFVTSAINILCGVLIVSYVLYITSPEIIQRFHHKPVYISTVFVLMGLLRYLQITLVEGKSGAPTTVLIEDHFLQVTVLLWILFFAILIYVR